jgi:hypothetical protein
VDDLELNDVLTRVERYNLIRNGRMLYIDVHEQIAGTLAAEFVAVPNLINIVAKQEYQGSGSSVTEALQMCLSRIKGLNMEELFPKK